MYIHVYLSFKCKVMADSEAQQYCQWNAVYTGPWSPVYSGPGPASTHYSYYLPQEPGSHSQSQPQREPYRSNEQPRRYSYDVKIINPKKKSDFVVRRWHGVSDVIRSPAALKVKLHESFPHDVPASSNIQVGYLEGNNKRWIFEELDLDVMYDSFQPGSKITLWCDGIHTESTSEPSAKKRRTTSSVSTASNSPSETTDNVDQIFKELKCKHSDMENTKLRLWAKLIEKGRYDDLDNPPQIPLITGSPAPAKKKHDNISTALVDAATVVAKAFQTSHTSTVTTDGSPVRHSIPTGHLEPPSKLSPFKLVCPITPKLFGRFEIPKRLVSR